MGWQTRMSCGYRRRNRWWSLRPINGHRNKTNRQRPRSRLRRIGWLRRLGRNAVCLISILDKDKAEFADPQFLKKILRGDSRPYVSSPDELAKLDLKELRIDGGLGFYVNFADPEMVGKPVKRGSYKTATPILLSIGSRYLIKVTIPCDEINGTDYQEAIKIVESIRIKEE
jgi:hypothetical protein